MPIDRKDVTHVARLARLDLSEQEISLFQEQLSKILAHAEKVTSLDTEGVPATAHAIPLSNVFRSDEIGPSLEQDEALANAPVPENGHFRVPRIIEDEG